MVLSGRGPDSSVQIGCAASRHVIVVRRRAGVSSLRSVVSTAKKQIRKQREDDAHEDGSCDRDVKTEPLTFDDHVAGQPAETQLFSQNHGAADDDQQGAKEQEGSPEAGDGASYPYEKASGSSLGGRLGGCGRGELRGRVVFAM